MIVLTGQLVCADTREAAVVRHRLAEHIALTRAESGCLRFIVEPTGDPLVWAVQERFVDQAAFDSHQSRVRASEWGRATAGITREYTVASVTDEL